MQPQYKSKYIEKNLKESHVYLFTSLEIKNYIRKFLADYGLTLHTYQINFLESKIDLFISYYQTSKSLAFIQKANLDQKVKLKKKRFTKTLNKIHIKQKNKNIFSEYLKNYYTFNNSFIKKRLLTLLNALEVLKLEYYSLKYSRRKKNLVFKHKKKVLLRYYINCFKYFRYLSFLLKEKNEKKRLKTLNYYKTYKTVKQYKTFNNYKSNNFIEKLIEGLVLFTKSQFSISLTIKQINKSLKFPKKRIQNFKRILSKLRKFQKSDFFHEGINVFFNAMAQKNSADLIATYIANQLKFMKRHKFFLTFVTKALTLLISQKFAKIKGIKLKVRGRINNSARSKVKTLTIGKISLITVNNYISHAQQVAYGANGTLGVQVWVETNSN